MLVMTSTDIADIRQTPPIARASDYQGWLLVGGNSWIRSTTHMHCTRCACMSRGLADDHVGFMREHSDLPLATQYDPLATSLCRRERHL